MPGIPGTAWSIHSSAGKLEKETLKLQADLDREGDKTPKGKQIDNSSEDEHEVQAEPLVSSRLIRGKPVAGPEERHKCMNSALREPRAQMVTK